jgi:hypothetical protein
MAKKVIQYYPNVMPCRIVVGERADVVVTEHPNVVGSNRWVSTSRVLNHEVQSGIFETLNSIYKPVIGETK